MEENMIIGQPFMSAEINEISGALSEFQGSVEQPKLEKEVKVNSQKGGYSFKYADLSACVKAAAPKLKELGLAVAQLVFEGKLVTLLTHKSGQWMKSEIFLPPPSNNYQSYGGAITYLKRYSYCAILGLVADTDDDANMACGNNASLKNTGGPLDFKSLMKKAVAEVNAAKNRDEFNDIWNRWSYDYPQITANGSEFWIAAGIKNKQLPQ